MLDPEATHRAGAIAIVFGAATVVVSLPLVIVGIATVFGRTASVAAAVDVLVHVVPVEAALGNPRGRLPMGLIGLGVGCWSLGVGLWVQGRAERHEKTDG
ncbi:hypothetical protein [Haladaptatus sp. DYF46]|uniref:hypothetical protein n=1 Tax=Haladaptatus sp. DYF46 TaxID=2886041 RepID=UPI001E3D45DA|nr:hypothetical protein [Haladaptatus sp. DYF46]